MGTPAPKLWTLKRIVGTIVAVTTAAGGLVLAILTAGSRQELLDRLEDWLGFLSRGAVWALGFISVPPLIVLAGVLVGLWAWDVHKLAAEKIFGDPNDPRVLAEARKKKVRVQVGDSMRSLYNDTARHAAGAILQQTAVVVHGLRSAPINPLKQIAASLLTEYVPLLQSSIRGVLDAQHCDTDAELSKSLDAWGELFFRYQRLAHYINEAYTVSDQRPWNRVDYDEWRKWDAPFLSAMREAEHMEGCERLAVKIRDAGWGDDDRPPDTQTAQN